MIYKLLNCFKNGRAKRFRLISQFRYINGLNNWDLELTTEVKHKIETHWSQRLSNDVKNKYDNSNLQKREKYYVLSMFPYPSGSLHMGHVRVYTISDAVARFQRMNNKNVIHPIGWDAFGLPAENAAIDRGISPAEWTQSNINHMKKQLKHLGCSFEWDREITTCDPRYYKWTQALFLKLVEEGLAYQKEALVNWDPVDCTVLADEQVDGNGCSWRSGAKVEKKMLKQWFVQTTKFAKSLQDGLDDKVLQDWRDIIKLQQHWIGECNGVAVDFNIQYENKIKPDHVITFWTDKPEYLDRVEFIAISDQNLISKQAEILTSLNAATKLLKVTATNPITNAPIKIYLTGKDDVEFMQWTDSHLGMPSVNEEDQAFIKKYNIEDKSFKPLTDMEVEKNRAEFIKKLQELNAGGYFTSAKLRDWLISRQRYWGTPIPIIHCKDCGAVPVPREELPVVLPQCDNVSRSGSALTANESWKKVSCPKCNQPAERETDTMDTFVDSSWYFLRYLNRDCNADIFDVPLAKSMTPVDLYIGGKEHAVLHLYYSRFISHFLHSLGMLPEREPFKRLLVQGMVMGRSYRVKGSGKYLHESQVNVINLKQNKATCKETGAPVVMQWEKMSKSKYNGTDPEEMFKEYGIDTTRLLILADVAPTSHRNWNSNTFPGVLNWQRRLWITVQDFLKHRRDMPEIANADEYQTQEDYMFDSRNFYIKGTTFNYCDSQQISVAISKLQGLTNSIRRVPNYVVARSLQYERALACQIILMAPMAPHFASELWSGFLAAPNRLNHSGEIDWNAGVLHQRWPDVDWDYKLELVFQVNGSERDTVKIARKELEKLPKGIAVDMALQAPRVQSVLAVRNILDVDYVIYSGYEGVVNFITDQPPPKQKADEVVEAKTVVG